MGNSEHFRQFPLEVLKTTQAGAGGVDMVQGATQEIIEQGVRMPGLDRLFEEPVEGRDRPRRGEADDERGIGKPDTERGLRRSAGSPRRSAAR